MQCRRCQGKGELVIRHGKPDPDRDTHEPYNGPWCVLPPRTCPVCEGTGEETDKPNPVAGMRIHMDAWGWVTKRSQL